MSKALAVLAECVDQRSGKRFFTGDVFDPPPTPEQAQRLVRAGCLPGDAIEAARKAAADADKKAAADAKKATAASAARDKVNAAKQAREAAEAELAAADADKKAAAEKALAEARQAEEEAEDALKALK
jgi:colicin import membrane protein